MADIKGKLNVTDIVVDNTGTINGKHIATSVNGVEANSTGMVDVSTIGTLQKNRDLNSVTKSEFHFFDQNSTGAPNIPELLEDSLGVGLTLDVPNLSTELVAIPFGDDIKLCIRINPSESKNPTSWSPWQYMASQTYVQDYVRDNGGSGSTSGYTKDEADAKFLPITSEKVASVGKLIISNQGVYPGIEFNVNSGDKCGIEATNGKVFTFWADDRDGIRNTSIKVPTSTGTFSTQEWSKELLHSRIVYNSDSTDILPQSLNKAGFYMNVKTGFIEFKNGTGSRFLMSDTRASFGNDIQIRTNYADSKRSMIEVVSPDAKQNIVLSTFNAGVDTPTISVMDNGVLNHIKLAGVSTGTLATREWTNQYVRAGGADTETLLTARDNTNGASQLFVRSNDHNFGAYLNGVTRFRVTQTAAVLEGGCRTLAVNGKSNSTSDRPQLILDSVADLWRMEPDGAGKLQIIHPATGALYEFEKVGGTQQVASKQWVNAQGFSKGSTSKVGNSRVLRTLTGITSNTWGTSTRGILFSENLNNKLVFVSTPMGSAFIPGNGVVVDLVAGSITVQAWIDGEYIKYSWNATTSMPSIHKVTILEFY